jgi:hypothetical protein
VNFNCIWETGQYKKRDGQMMVMKPLEIILISANTEIQVLAATQKQLSLSFTGKS